MADNLEYTAAASVARKYESLSARKEICSKSCKKPEPLSPDIFWVCFCAGERLKEPESDSHGFAMVQRTTMKVISQNWILRKERGLKSTRMWARRKRKWTM